MSNNRTVNITINIREIPREGRVDTESLLGLWKRSVRATHHFLSEEDIGEIADEVSDALKNIATLIVAEDELSTEIGFIGLEGDRIEMLFVSPEYIGCGVGSSLVRYAVGNYFVREVCVNEQNIEAYGFYERLGFEINRRTEKDEQGRPYPLLYLKLKDR